MKDIVKRNRSHLQTGICSICSAHPFVIEAALRFEQYSDNKVLIEATSNQVNQFGGYTGMRPDDFRLFVEDIASRVGFPRSRLVLGGDHLGPNCWQHEPAEIAMQKAEELVAAYVKAGFSKIHLDASMSCCDDPTPLSADEIAQRAAQLCLVAENSATPEQKQQLCYVIGTEVPVPGGETSSIEAIHISQVTDVAYTLESHYRAFRELGIEGAIERIIAVVVQPGVEFDHSKVIVYQSDKTKDLKEFIQQTSLVFEAHSTDYQPKQAYRQLVNDHFAILKVGPALTFALREAIFALAHIEQSLIAPEERSQILDVIDHVMLNQPEHWHRYYQKPYEQRMIDLHYSLSDRIRYYWPNCRINQSMNKLIHNLSQHVLPLGLLSQFLPVQFERVMTGQIIATPHALLIDKIQDVLRGYAFGCRGGNNENQ